MSVQLPLGLRLRDSATFDGFVPGGSAAAVDSLRSLAQGGEPPMLYLWGAPGTGRTHLLQAACHHAAGCDRAAAYAPLADAGELTPELLDGMELQALVCLDDADAVAAQPRWEEALFTLFNRVREAGGHLAVAAAAPPARAGFRLPDLVSRLSWGAVFHLHELDDNAKSTALMARARARGMDMPGEVARYLLRHCPRDMRALFALLERLDTSSLAAQRRLTIPFVKEVLERGG